ncbi:hypothetical protein O7635_00140 [Asanoa sp. WMMD1127]|nr:hypothetical protein [Asanoa sp. WMMD1127]MDG4820280.1 hypothetical protein [Asanoa sp. WMMD1127]
MVDNLLDPDWLPAGFFALTTAGFLILAVVLTRLRRRAGGTSTW